MQVARRHTGAGRCGVGGVVTGGGVMLGMHLGLYPHTTWLKRHLQFENEWQELVLVAAYIIGRSDEPKLSEVQALVAELGKNHLLIMSSAGCITYRREGASDGTRLGEVAF